MPQLRQRVRRSRAPLKPRSAPRALRDAFGHGKSDRHRHEYGLITWAVRVGTRIVFYNENRLDAPVYASISIGRSSDKLVVIPGEPGKPDIIIVG